MTIQWEDPTPIRRRGRSPFLTAAVLDALRSNPGRWAKVHTIKAGSSIGTNWRRRFGPEGFEFTQRRLTDDGDSSAIYARYVGKAVAP